MNLWLAGGMENVRDFAGPKPVIYSAAARSSSHTAAQGSPAVGEKEEPDARKRINALSGETNRRRKPSANGVSVVTPAA